MTLIGGSCWLNKGHPLETTTYKNLNKSWNCPWLRIWIFLWHRCIWSNILELWFRLHNLSQAGEKWPCGKKNIQNDTRTILSENSYFEPQTIIFLHFLFGLLQLHKFCKYFLCTEVVILKSVIHILHVNDSNVVFVAL